MSIMKLPPVRLTKAGRVKLTRALAGVSAGRDALLKGNRTLATLVKNRESLRQQIDRAESDGFSSDVRAVARELPQARECLVLTVRRIERLESGLQPQCQALREALASLSAEFIGMTSAWLAEIEQRYAADLTPFFCGDGRPALHGVKSMPLLVNLGHFSAGLPRTWTSSSTLLAVLADAEQSINWTACLLALRRAIVAGPFPFSVSTGLIQ